MPYVHIHTANDIEIFLNYIVMAISMIFIAETNQNEMLPLILCNEVIMTWTNGQCGWNLSTQYGIDEKCAEKSYVSVIKSFVGKFGSEHETICFNAKCAPDEREIINWMCPRTLNNNNNNTLHHHVSDDVDFCSKNIRNSDSHYTSNVYY